MKSTIIQAVLFSLIVHVIVIGGVFAYLEYENKQKIKQGYFAAEYGFQIAGGTTTSLLVITFIALAAFYIVVKFLVSKFLLS
jgi:hypothetical protein